MSALATSSWRFGHCTNDGHNDDEASTLSTMTDFLQRENELLGDEFAAPTDTGGTFATAAGADDIDFDRAAEAFPDISLDGTSDIPVPAAPTHKAAVSSGSFSFDSFTPPPTQKTTEVKVTGDDEIEKFEDQFPEIDVPSVCLTFALFSCCQLTMVI